MGLNAPKFAQIEGITPDCDDEDYDDLIADESMAQPWDDYQTEEIENPVNDQPVILNNEHVSSNSDSKVDPIGTEDSEIQTFDRKILVRIAPRVRTTWQGVASTEPLYREVVDLVGFKVDRDGNELIKVLCKGDHPKYAFWSNKMSITCDNIEELITDLKHKHVWRHEKGSVD